MDTACLVSRWARLRTRVYLSARAARRGRCSQILSPGRRVAIGLNSPRISAGASGFMSNISRWLGPPVRKMRITDFRFREALRRCRGSRTAHRQGGQADTQQTGIANLHYFAAVDADGVSMAAEGVHGRFPLGRIDARSHLFKAIPQSAHGRRAGIWGGRCGWESSRRRSMPRTRSSVASTFCSP